MAAIKGQPRPPGAGRKKGTPNKRTWEAREVAARLHFDPVEQLVAWAEGDWKKLGYDSPQKRVVTEDGTVVMVDRIDEHLRQKSAKDVVPYIYPQLKSIEVTGEGAAAAALTLTALVALTAKAAPKEEKNVGEHTEPAGSPSGA